MKVKMESNYKFDKGQYNNLTYVNIECNMANMDIVRTGTFDKETKERLVVLDIKDSQITVNIWLNKEQRERIVSLFSVIDCTFPECEKNECYWKGVYEDCPIFKGCQ